MPKRSSKRPTSNAISRWSNEGGAPPEGDESEREHPRDINQTARRIVDAATGETDTPAPPDTRNPAAVSLGRLGGLKGGKARAKALSPEKRKEIAEKAAKTRWKK